MEAFRQSMISPCVFFYYDSILAAHSEQGYNVVILSFLLTTGPIARAQEFVALNATQRAKIISDYHARGISITVAAFGDSESPTGAGKDPVLVAKNMADFVKKYNVGDLC
jgi:chitinase